MPHCHYPAAGHPPWEAQVSGGQPAREEQSGNGRESKSEEREGTVKEGTVRKGVT
jgi:hypothetical protein